MIRCTVTHATNCTDAPRRPNAARRAGPFPTASMRHTPCGARSRGSQFLHAGHQPRDTSFAQQAPGPFRTLSTGRPRHAASSAAPADTAQQVQHVLDAFTVGLLERHVQRSCDDVPGLRQVHRIKLDDAADMRGIDDALRPCEAEVDDTHPPVGAEDGVFWFEVTVDHAVGVRGRQPTTGLQVDDERRESTSGEVVGDVRLLSGSSSPASGRRDGTAR